MRVAPRRVQWDVPGKLYRFSENCTKRVFLTFRSPCSNIVGECSVADGKRKGDNEMNYQVLLYEKKDSIATVTFNRPERRNAWSGQVSKEFIDVFHHMEADPEVLVTILTGN